MIPKKPEFCPSCGEIAAEQRAEYRDLIWFHLGLEQDMSKAPRGIEVFCELCLVEFGGQRRVSVSEADGEEFYAPVTNDEINLFLARRLAQMAERLAQRRPIVRCQSIASGRDVRCDRYAVRQLDDLWLCGPHTRPRALPATPYRFGLQRRSAAFFLVSGGPAMIARQLCACLAPDEIVDLVRLLEREAPREARLPVSFGG